MSTAIHTTTVASVEDRDRLACINVAPDYADRIDPDAWPAVAEGIAVRAIREALPNLPPSTSTVIARRIMADLVTAGLLLTDAITTGDLR